VYAIYWTMSNINCTLYSMSSSTIVLFHSALGLRPAVRRFADRLREWGHTVHTPDLYDGKVFETLEDGIRYRDVIGIPGLMERARKAVEPLPAEAVYAGFSLGAAPAQLLAATRPGARRAILMHGALTPAMLGLPRWPPVPVQVHYAAKDPWVDAAEVEALSRSARESGAACSVFTYEGSGHLFADEDGADYDPAAAAAMLEHVREFLRQIGD
jgi:dienelactone hydrolase